MTWSNRVTRIVTWARLYDTAHGRSFHVFNPHWDHSSQPSRERSAEPLLDQIATRAAPGEPYWCWTSQGG